MTDSQATPETLIPTMTLRWAKVKEPDGWITDTLQQLFHTPGGDKRWIDVPTELIE